MKNESVRLAPAALLVRELPAVVIVPRDVTARRAENGQTVSEVHARTARHAVTVHREIVAIVLTAAHPEGTVLDLQTEAAGRADDGLISPDRRMD